MKKWYLLSIAALAVTILFSGRPAYADDSALLKSIQDDRAKVEDQLGLVEPPITNVPDEVEYAGAKADHYERTLITKDEIDASMA